MLEGVGEVGAHVAGRTAQLETHVARKQCLQEHLQFHSSEPGSQAEVSAESETHVLVGMTSDIESIRLGENRWISIRRRIPHHHPIPRAHFRPRDLRVPEHGPAEVVDGARPAQYLLDSTRQQVGIRLQELPLLRELVEGQLVRLGEWRSDSPVLGRAVTVAFAPPGTWGVRIGGSY